MAPSCLLLECNDLLVAQCLEDEGDKDPGTWVVWGPHVSSDSTGFDSTGFINT